MPAASAGKWNKHLVGYQHEVDKGNLNADERDPFVFAPTNGSLSKRQLVKFYQWRLIYPYQLHINN